ncbi:MAG: hypothetical protein C4332_15805 [Meiothermus sp.]
MIRTGRSRPASKWIFCLFISFNFREMGLKRFGLEAGVFAVKVSLGLGGHFLQPEICVLDSML